MTAAVPVSGLKTESPMPLKVVSLPCLEAGHWWFLSTISGSLIKSSSPLIFGGAALEPKIQQALTYCDNPFSLRPSDDYELLTDEFHARKDLRKIERINRIFFYLGNRRFIASIFYAGHSNPIFKNTKSAFKFVSELPGHKNCPGDRCFQRSLFAAKCSESFFHFGVLLIGANFATGEMHAWIIENNEQPDPEDRAWINYRPLMALCF
jgi:hypothetical protein